MNMLSEKDAITITQNIQTPLNTDSNTQHSSTPTHYRPLVALKWTSKGIKDDLLILSHQ